jgi:signal transduction histidine kinase
VIPFEKLLLQRPVVRAFAAAACLSIVLLAWVGYVAVREWQNSVMLLGGRQAEDAADRFFTELTRDMQAVQRQVLQSPALDAFASVGPPLDPSYEAVNLVASAFARYSYPESFFFWSRAPVTTPTAFFYRRDRRPPWSSGADDPGRFPVVIDERSPIGGSVLGLIQRDAGQGRPFVVLETTLNGIPYQVVARLLYRDAFRQNIDTVFGFMVNLTWARDHYFAGLLQQTLSADSSRRAVVLSILDDQGQKVAETGAVKGAGAASPARRTFRPMFFNPLLVAAEPPSAQQRRWWTIEAVTRGDSSLLAAAAAANRMLILQIVAAVMLAAGIILSLRAARAGLRLSELRSDFVASVTHEFKTPIATIRAAGETLAAGRLDGAAARQDYARYIVQEARRLTRLVDNLLAFSRLTDSVEVKHPIEPVALADVVADTIERFSVQLTGGDFQVEVSVPGTLPLVSGDPGAIALMLDNLVDNAIRHSRNQHRLSIRAKADARTVFLEVADGGGGIPEDEIKHVTKRFFRGRHAGHGGTGLGLAIAARIVAEHGGALEVVSEAGVGTTVRVTLPVLNGHRAQTAQARAGAEHKG